MKAKWSQRLLHHPNDAARTALPQVRQIRWKYPQDYRDPNQSELPSRATTLRRRGADVLVAVWCRSVGACWTLELYQLERDTSPRIITDWITSGVPISQPAPDVLVEDLLASRGLELFRDPSAGPCTHNRHGIGYVSTNTEVIRLAPLVSDEAAETSTHPVALATQIMAGYFPNTAAE